MAGNELLTGTIFAGVSAALVGFWNQIKSLLWKVVSIVIQKVEINTEEAHEAVTSYLVENFQRLSIYDRVYGAKSENFRTGQYGLVPYEKFGSRTLLFWTGRRFRSPVFAFSREEQKENSEQRYYQANLERKFSSLIFVRGTLKVDEIVEAATKMRNVAFWEHKEAETESNRFDIFYLPNKEPVNSTFYSRAGTNLAWYKQQHYRLLGIDQSELGRERTVGRKALENLFFPKEVKDLIGLIELWVKSRDWYKRKNIPWKRGWLLYGPPGTGKTALVRAFAEDLNMPIYVYSLSQMSNSDFNTAWKSMQVNTPCIALIEDIDSVFRKRENISRVEFQPMPTTQPTGEGGGAPSPLIALSPMTFDCLLNNLDGVDKSNGIFTIITTNDLDSIDAALGVPRIDGDSDVVSVSTRPGRIDRTIKLSYMTPECKKDLARMILEEFPEKLETIIAEIDLRGDETPAQFQEYCSQIAIQEFWDMNEKQRTLIPPETRA
jgi:hypothetical protein